MKMWKHKVGIIALIAVIGAIGLVVAGCDNGNNDGGKKYDPVSVTVTLKNTTTGATAVNITGLYVKVDKPDGSGYNFPLGGSEPPLNSGGLTTYNTQYTVAAGGSLTLPAFTVPLRTDAVEGYYSESNIAVDLEKASTHTGLSSIGSGAWYKISYGGITPSATLTLELVESSSNPGIYYELKKVN